MTSTVEITTELSRLGTATILEAQDKTGGFPSRLRPLDGHQRMAGRALTVLALPGDNLALHLAVESAQSGDVLVVNAFGFHEAGAWGDVLTAFAQQRGVAGLVIDGAVRDTAEIVQAGFPVFTSGISIKGTTKNNPGMIGGDVVIDGLKVAHGDYIFGDGDGVVAVPTGRLEDTWKKARERHRTEEGFLSKIRSGSSTVDLLGLSRDGRM